ncbi:MAG: type II toxin-antitoxin system VapC family toxin [Selenomonadaceae bacterium]|nr:type II toxin-antitoxin system VapC family toxin [Selenomonadaceae bacterium]MBP3722655.1 type II toxin-antitoxin system VapC family toxin [Selenomonadaceae bacterium]
MIGERVFLDTAPFVYLIEQKDILGVKARKIFNELLYQESPLITSTITVTEYLVHPIRNNETAHIEVFWQIIDFFNVELLDIDKHIAMEAAKIRAENVHLKGMDSLQLAAAKVAAADVFLTNDIRLKSFNELKIVILQDGSNL